MIFTYERELMSDVFHRNHVAFRVQRDPRTRLGKNLLLGYPFHRVRYCVIKNGAVDFDSGHRARYGVLTPDDLVALYGYLYLPRHYAELRSTFDRCSTQLPDSSNSGRSTWLIDLGCGPGTAGLAFADHCGGDAFHYLGIDRSVAMRSAARVLLEKARASGLIDPASEIETASGPFDIPEVLGTCPAPVNVVFVASYLFASKSLDPVALARSVNAVTPYDHVRAAVFLYLNSATRFANRSYEQFVGELVSHKRLGLKEQVIGYRRYAGRTTGTARFVSDGLVLKESAS